MLEVTSEELKNIRIKMFVTSEELKNIRIKMLKEMNEYVVTKIKDPQDVLLWHCFCIPEDPTEEDYLENAMNDEFEKCSTFFMGIVNREKHS